MKYKRHKTPEYYAWHSIKNRCLNPRVSCFKNYGGRGIRICDRWINNFENFLSDMGKRPSNKYSIDRINNNGNYEPNNCRWLLRSKQNLNRRSCTVLNIDNVIDTITGHSIRSGINRKTISIRLFRGWSMEELLNKPYQRRLKCLNINLPM